MFDPLNPTVQMLGRWQPWHEGHQELFKRCHAMTGQVCIMIRQVPEKREANSRVPGQDDNPFDIATVQQNIIDGLAKDGFTIQQDYVIMVVPNIVDISYGRGVGYTFTEHDLGKDIHEISATQIRAQMREEGKLADKS
jgi:phosphopantetheine adenylyltransferase